MVLSQIQKRGPQPLSASNLTLAHATIEAPLLRPNSKAEEGQLRVVRDERQEELDQDLLGPARGIVNGLRLSVTLWSFIAIVVLLLR
jgi:molybdopterin-guanine dinucleotide biosynthesis protein A